MALKQQSVEEKLKAINQHKEEYIQWHDGAVARIKQEANQQIQKTQADFRYSQIIPRFPYHPQCRWGIAGSVLGMNLDELLDVGKMTCKLLNI